MNTSMYQILLCGKPYLEEELRAALQKYPFRYLYDYQKIDRTLPFISLFYAPEIIKLSTDEQIFYEKCRNEECVLPIVPDLSNFTSLTPDVLQTINGVALDGPESIVHIKNYVLTFFGFIEGNRKVFISYKRTDCQELARQLYDAFSHANFIPFLDAYTIEPGVDFQAHLLQELSDSEIMVFINTTDYGKSKWCVKELENASQMSVGIVEVRFESSEEYNEAILALKIEMGTLLPSNSQYAPSALNQIVSGVEKYRAESYALRRDNNVKLFKEKYEKMHFKTLFPNILYSNRDKVAGVIMNHIPSSTDAQNAFNTLQEKLKVNEKWRCNLEYFGACCTPKRQRHYMWLNNFLPIHINDITQL